MKNKTQSHRQTEILTFTEIGFVGHFRHVTAAVALMTAAATAQVPQFERAVPLKARDDHDDGRKGVHTELITQ